MQYTKEKDIYVIRIDKEEERKPTLAEYFKEVVYGGVDGIVTTFAVVSGFSGAALSSDLATQLSFTLVLLFGLANLFADAISMGLGNFLSVRSEKDQYEMMRKRERTLIRSERENELLETVTIMKSKGFSEEDAKTLAAIYGKNEEYWLDFMMANEHELSDPRGDNPYFTGFATFGSFFVFGSIPILPFLILGDSSAELLFQISSVGTFVALVILGVMKWRLVGTGLVRSVSELVLIGGSAAMIAFLVGTFFKI